MAEPSPADRALVDIVALFDRTPFVAGGRHIRSEVLLAWVLKHMAVLNGAQAACGGEPSELLHG